MKFFTEATADLSRPKIGGIERLIFAFGIDPMAYRHFTLELEPIIGGGYLVAVYEHRADRAYPELILPDKIPVLPMEATPTGDQAIDAQMAKIDMLMRMRAAYREVTGTEASEGKRRE